MTKARPRQGRNGDRWWPASGRWRRAGGRLVLLAVLALAGCGRPTDAQRPRVPSQVLGFDPLYGQHCAGCHGADGRVGPAPPLNDRLFLAIVTDAELRRIITEGRRPLMPGFSPGRGGSLTPQQVDALVTGIRARWGAPLAAGTEALPVYRIEDATRKGTAPGTKKAGERIFAVACAGCHGDQGQGGHDAGAINDPAFLALISDQALRRIVITGRPDLGMPGYHQRGDRPAGFKPLSPQQISDVVALLASWRKPTGGTP